MHSVNFACEESSFAWKARTFISQNCNAKHRTNAETLNPLARVLSPLEIPRRRSFSKLVSTNFTAELRDRAISLLFVQYESYERAKGFQFQFEPRESVRRRRRKKGEKMRDEQKGNGGEIWNV